MSKRVVNILKTTGKEFPLIKSYAKRLNILLNDEYQKISDEDFQRILNLIEKEPEEVLIPKKGSRELFLTDALPEVFNQYNPFAQFQTDLINNSIEKRSLNYILINDISVETVFNDFEAYSICRGISISRAIKIAKDYFIGKEDETRIEAHEFAMTAYKKYGFEILNFALRFPPLPFKAFDARSLFTELDRKAKETGLPIIRVAYSNEFGKPEKLELKFYVERESEKTRVYRNVIEIRNKTTNSKVASITRQGRLVAAEGSRNIIPIIQLFIRYSSDLGKLQINYGLETGECSICARELTDPISIKRGIGPNCYKNLAK
jgi:hypothetical protein